MNDFVIESDDETPEPSIGNNTPEFSVSEISAGIKRSLEDKFGYVRVRGEIGRVSLPRSGHVYLDLKDDRAVLGSVIWKGVAARLKVKPEEGMEVIATGRISSFPGQSKYQLIIDNIAPAGVGALMAMLDARKKKLAAEGLFSPENKSPLPYMPKVIGVVTSPSGAVIRDILHRLAERFPTHVLIWPVAVQGEKCAPEVSAGIEGFNALPKEGPVPRPDLIIVARGGGSLEDLWGFNEESVVRAAAASDIPLISAVGHETDTTLIDFASDQRAPTPTAAAEMAVPVRADLLTALAGLEERRLRASARLFVDRQKTLTDLARSLPKPEALISDARQKFDNAATALPRGLKALTQQKRVQMAQGPAGSFSHRLLSHRLQNTAERLQALQGRSNTAIKGLSKAKKQIFHGTKDRLQPASIKRVCTQYAQELSRIKIDALMDTIKRDKSRQMETTARLLETVGYKATLARGYAVIRSADNKPVSSTTKFTTDMPVIIELQDGSTGAKITDNLPKKQIQKKQTSKPRTSNTDDRQGSLFD